MNDAYIPENEWEKIVSNVPIVSVDIVVLHDGGVVLGKRTNEPAEGEWFVPGGRVHKNERLRDAVHRIAKDELDVEVRIRKSLGPYEHIYQTSDINDDIGKHYIAHGFVVNTIGQPNFKHDGQHGEIRVFNTEGLPQDIHTYLKMYLRDAELFGLGNSSNSPRESN